MGRFLEVYAPAKSIADALRANTRTIANRLEKLGIVPIHMPDGCRGRIFAKTGLRSIEAGVAMLNAVDNVALAKIASKEENFSECHRHGAVQI